MIVKCQLSLFTTHAARQMLFYSQHRNHMWEGDITSEWLERFDKFGLKFFAHVRWRDDGAPEFLQVTNHHSW